MKEMMFYDIEIGDRVFDALVAMDIESGDDGIGSYEFWGSCGYDSRPYVCYTFEGILRIDESLDEGDTIIKDVKNLDSDIKDQIEEYIEEEIGKMEVDEDDD